MLNNVMVDLETLGTTADAAIISIGAVRFDLESDEIDDNGFYASISIESNAVFKRTISEDTLKWWMQQSKEAQVVFTEPKVSLYAALVDFSDWIKSFETADVFMWSNGADFDLPMLIHAYDQAIVEPPWKFYNNRCFRTYKNLPGAKDIRGGKPGIKHNALADAIYQAQTLQLIHRKLFK